MKTTSARSFEYRSLHSTPAKQPAAIGNATCENRRRQPAQTSRGPSKGSRPGLSEPKRCADRHHRSVAAVDGVDDVGIGAANRAKREPVRRVGKCRVFVEFA